MQLVIIFSQVTSKIFADLPNFIVIPLTQSKVLLQLKAKIQELSLWYGRETRNLRPVRRVLVIKLHQFLNLCLQDSRLRTYNQEIFQALTAH